MQGIRLIRPVSAVACLAVLFLSSSSALAQARRAAASSPAARPSERLSQDVPIKILEIEGLKSRARIKTPVFTTSLPRGMESPGEWVQVSVVYASGPKWIDELTIRFHVLAQKEEDGKRVYSLYRVPVVYVDIDGERRRHEGMVFLRPSTLKRYGDPVAVAAEFVIDGKVVAEAEDTSIDMPDKWWNAPVVTQREGVVLREGLLLSRKETPFALVAIDDHEVIK